MNIIRLSQADTPLPPGTSFPTTQSEGRESGSLGKTLGSHGCVLAGLKTPCPAVLLAPTPTTPSLAYRAHPVPGTSTPVAAGLGPLCTHGVGSSSPSGLTQWIGGKHRVGKTPNKTEIKAVLQR